MRSYKIKVFGRVQGVWYRRFTKEIADEMGINGEVKNLSDGNVEIKASLDENLKDDFLKALKKGPPLAKVEKIEIEEIKESFKGFKIVR
jgi:acylphosphatase